MEVCKMDSEHLTRPPLSSEQLLEDNTGGTACPGISGVAPLPDVDVSTESHNPSVEPAISKIPVELILKTLELTDLRSAFNLARTNKAFKRIWDGNREHLIMSILRTELSPFDDLLQHVVSGPDDINVPLGPCLRRTIYHMNKLCCEGEIPQLGEEGHVLLLPVVLTGEHFDRLLNLFKVVKGWEQLFPRYRFGSAADCRELRPNESERLRAALYRWMSYAYFFHGDLPRPNKFVPQKYSTDIRCKRLRLLSDVELHELNDLWETVQKMVKCNICPSAEAVLKEMVSLPPPRPLAGFWNVTRVGMKCLTMREAGLYNLKGRSRAHRLRLLEGGPRAGHLQLERLDVCRLRQQRPLGHRRHLPEAPAGRGPPPRPRPLRLFEGQAGPRGAPGKPGHPLGQAEPRPRALCHHGGAAGRTLEPGPGPGPGRQRPRPPVGPVPRRR